jgi:ABC-type hemin transport system substrate-binding protein
LAVITHPKESLTSITTAVIEVVQIINQEQHSKNMMARQQADIQINQLLDRTINDVQADVILILEGHNGNENINGLGFSYLKTTYKKEKCTDYKAPLFV